MIRLTEIHSLTDFLRNHKEHMTRIAETQRPELLTVNGRARVVVQDAEGYEELSRKAERLDRLEAVLWALSAGRAGRPVTIEALLSRAGEFGTGEAGASETPAHDLDRPRPRTRGRSSARPRPFRPLHHFRGEPVRAFRHVPTGNRRQLRRRQLRRRQLRHPRLRRHPLR